jgi:hypothetical protein
MAIQIVPRKARREVDILITVALDGQRPDETRTEYVFRQAREELQRAQVLARVDPAQLDAEVAALQARVVELKANKLVLDLEG